MTSLDQPLNIRGVLLKNRVFLAPMSGVSDLPFRKRAAEAGAGMVVSEMVASAELCNRHRESLLRLSGEGLGTHVVQLAGREARWMGEAAKIAEGEGADIIDINMGCPAKKVTGGYSGSALMRNLDHAMTLVEATVAAVKVPVTLKMRLGWDENSINAPELARRAEDAGIAMVTVHGRTRCQFYEGTADWDAIHAVRDAVRIPLVANGDVSSRADAEEILRRSGADAVMVGRASYGQPWLAGVIAGSDFAPRDANGILDYIIIHYEDMLDHYGSKTGIRHARKHLGWYMDRHAGRAFTPADKAELMTLTDQAAVVETLRRIFQRDVDPLRKVA
ncbi:MULTISPECIES: tRNA dihydrouridine synthase DusB [unclassified Brucella]|uniref:tRNA dihydrouridine synthase DusB n=1 Tax=unclassified Brucella TaxID=2632610 RepID=UPI0015E01263|nr:MULTISPECIES: tRNA dihydrouridine synthase DusB [unclassified Brucella]CAB4327030.1 NifR3, nitrogen regulation protein Nifr3 [Brucella sp. 191011898]